MKTHLIIIFCFFLLSCGHRKTSININRNEVSIAQKEVTFKGIVPLINQNAMMQIGSDVVGANTIIHYKDPACEKKIDLVFKTISNDSLLIYQIFAKFSDNASWLSTDTLKVLFSTSDSIKSGIYSVLYSPVFCWTKPVHFTNFNLIGKVQGIQFAYWKYTNDRYAAAMPMGGNGLTFSLGNENKGFGAFGTSGYKIKINGEIPVLTLSVSSDFYKLIPSTFEHSFAAMGIPDNLRVKKTKPDMYNYLGWASWNTYKQNVSEKKIINSANCFKAEQIPVRWFLIDDGWLDVTDNKLNSYIPDKKKFPDEFKHLTLKLKNEFKINNVGVWHTLNGYWEGFNDAGKLSTCFNDIITYNDKIEWLSKTVKAFAFCKSLFRSGISFL